MPPRAGGTVWFRTGEGAAGKLNLDLVYRAGLRKKKTSEKKWREEGLVHTKELRQKKEGTFEQQKKQGDFESGIIIRSEKTGKGMAEETFEEYFGENIFKRKAVGKPIGLS